MMQRDQSVTEYAGELECIWREIDHYKPFLNRLYKFLMGLDSEYETLVNQILAREKVPNFEEALKLMVWEESTRHLRHDLKSNPESTTFATRKGKEPQGQPVSTEHKDAKQQYIKGDPNTDPNAHLFCTHCKK